MHIHFHSKEWNFWVIEVYVYFVKETAVLSRLTVQFYISTRGVLELLFPHIDGICIACLFYDSHSSRRVAYFTVVSLPFVNHERGT